MKANLLQAQVKSRRYGRDRPRSVHFRPQIQLFLLPCPTPCPGPLKSDRCSRCSRSLPRIGLTLSAHGWSGGRGEGFVANATCSGPCLTVPIGHQNMEQARRRLERIEHPFPVYRVPALNQHSVAELRSTLVASTPHLGGLTDDKTWCTCPVDAIALDQHSAVLRRLYCPFMSPAASKSLIFLLLLSSSG